jgi:hypothetical protein
MFGSLSTNTSTTNLTLADQLINDAHRRYLEQFFFNESSTTITTVSQQQAYDLPADYSKLKTGTLTIGQLKWNPTEVLTRRDWDNMNVFPYYADIPNNFYIYANRFNFWPIPSTTGNVITFNYKKRVPDLSFADYTTGTVSATLNSPTITGSGSSWLANYMPALPTALTAATTSTNSALPTYTYDNGTAGVGATITMSSAAVLTVGGVAIALNDIVLVKNETGTNAPYNGLYKCTTAGTSTVAAVLTRNTDNDATTEFVGKSVFVNNTYITWAYTNLTNPTIGTTNITMQIVGSAIPLNLWLKITAPSGDNQWYQISSIESATSLTLVNTYQGGSTSGASYTIGQMPLLLEDFHDILVFDALVTYFSSIVDNPNKLKEFTARRDAIFLMMDEYAGTKSLNVNLARQRLGQNPNLFPQSIG